MAMLWMDGFDWLDIGQSGSTIDWALMKRYSAATVTWGSGTDGSVVAGRNGGAALCFGKTGRYINTPVVQLYGDSVYCYIGFAVKTGAALLHNAPILNIMRHDRVQNYIYCWNDGSLKLYYYGAQFNPGLKPYCWYYIELGIKFAYDATGEYEIRINGVTVKQESSIRTAAQSSSFPSWTHVQFLPISHEALLDDIYICNGVGSINNSLLGDVKVPVLWPDGDNTQGWTRSAGGDNYALVDDGPVEAVDAENVWTDDDYVYSDDTPTTKDLYEYEALPAEYAGSTIQAVQVASVVRTTNPQALTLKNKCLSVDAEVVVGQETLMWDLYSLVTGIQETDPKTAVLWTPSGVAAAKFGVEVG